MDMSRQPNSHVLQDKGSERVQPDEEDPRYGFLRAIADAGKLYNRRSSVIEQQSTASLAAGLTACLPATAVHSSGHDFHTASSLESLADTVRFMDLTPPRALFLTSVYGNARSAIAETFLSNDIENMCSGHMVDAYAESHDDYIASDPMYVASVAFVDACDSAIDLLLQTLSAVVLDADRDHEASEAART